MTPEITDLHLQAVAAAPRSPRSDHRQRHWVEMRPARMKLKHRFPRLTLERLIRRYESACVVKRRAVRNHKLRHAWSHRTSTSGGSLPEVRSRLEIPPPPVLAAQDFERNEQFRGHFIAPSLDAVSRRNGSLHIGDGGLTKPDVRELV